MDLAKKLLHHPKDGNGTTREFKLPPLSAAVQKCLQELLKPEPDFALMVGCIRVDPGLTTEVLKVANSAQLAMGKQTADILLALTRVGHARLRQIVTQLALASVFDHGSTTSSLSLAHFVRHSAFVGQLCFELAQRVHPEMAPRLQLAGLLHDVGILVRAKIDPERMEALQFHCSTEKTGFAAGESALQLTPHSDVGADVVRSWNIPEEIVALVACHHGIAEGDSEESGGGVDARELAVVLLADVLAHRSGFGLPHSARQASIAGEWMKTLALEPEHIMDAVEKSSQTLKLLL